MRKGLISIIVPVYNTEKYLERCIKSLTCQTYSDLQIILVDDGSTDKSGIICEKWATADNRIEVVHKKNEGAGLARNAGLKRASGEYVCFVDSDDCIRPEMIEATCQRAYEKHADIVVFGYYHINGEKVTCRIPHTEKDIYIGDEVREEFLPDLIGPDIRRGRYTNLTAGTMCLYSMELLQNTGWSSVSERDFFSEDLYSQMRLYKDVSVVSVLREPFYLYFQREDSLSHSYDRFSMKILNDFYIDMLRLADECEYDEEVKERLAYPYFSFTIMYLKIICVSKLSRKQKKVKIQEVVLDRGLQKILSKTDFRKEKPARRLLLEMMKRKCWRICWLLVWVKIKSNGEI